MPKNYVVPILVSFPAESYDDALRQAQQLAEGLGDSEELSVSAVLDYEYDNAGCRTVYVHPSEYGAEEWDSLVADPSFDPTDPADNPAAR